MKKNIKIIAGVFALAAVISYFLIDANEKQFDQIEWKKSPTMCYKMVQDIIDTNMFFGKTKTEILSLLGNDTQASTLKGKDHLVYSLGKAPSFFEAKEETLIVVFENEKAVNIIHKYQN